MAFPIIVKDDWDLVENDDLWIDLERDGIQKNAGRNLIYARKDNKTSSLKNFLFEFDVYGRGVIAMTRILCEVKDKTPIRVSYLSKILKDGNWVTGIQDEHVKFFPIKDEATGKVCGWKLRLQTAPNIFTEVDVLKAGG